MLAPSAFAAKYHFSTNNLRKGCSQNVRIKVDTEGSTAIAGDTTISFDTNEVAINNVSIGDALPMQVFNLVTLDQIKLSGARFPLTGSFSGQGNMGTINLTPDMAANSVTLTYSPDLVVNNNLVDETITNVLTSVENQTFPVQDRYDVWVDGVGFCNRDNRAPTVQFVTPLSGSGNNPVDTNIIFSITDNRTGVDLDTLQFTIGGVLYDQNSPQVTITENLGVQRVEVDPDADFSEGQAVQMSVTSCDNAAPTVNCGTQNGFFVIFSPAPPPPVCGDGILSIGNGEQCDDGNTDSGDGCSALCFLETPPPPPPSCTDGFHNGDETGIDCGGSCPNACPTCVDGLLNQGEEAVDCGGPCPTCDPSESVCPSPDYTLVTICHNDEDDPQSPYSLAIPDSELNAYLAAGDTLGSCSLEDQVLPVAPEVEDDAVDDAVKAEEEEELIEDVEEVEAPDSQAAVNSQLQICRDNPDYAGANFDDVRADTDEDGLSDRTECYAGTHPVDPDTDSDGCTDGDEINQFSTDPLDGTDCSVAPDQFEIILTDPKPNWTLGILSPRFAGIAPLEAEAVTVTLIHADQKIVKALLQDLNGLLQSRDKESVLLAIEELEVHLKDARTFVEANDLDFDYDDLALLAIELERQKETLKADVISSEFALGSYYAKLQELAIGNLLLQLTSLQRDPVVAGSTNFFSEIFVGNEPANRFEFVSKRALQDRKLYNVVATATVEGEKFSSAPIRIGLNTGFSISRPVPRTLGGKSIPLEGVTFNGFVGFANAQGGEIEIEIDEDRPTVTGDSEFGSQVFAIWNSVVLSSSVISDSEQGAFEIQAPRHLEKNVPHRVTLYAVKSDGDNTLRSDSVDVYFRIKEGRIGLGLMLAALAVALFVLGFIVYKKMRSQALVKQFNLDKYKNYQSKK